MKLGRRHLEQRGIKDVTFVQSRVRLYQVYESADTANSSATRLPVRATLCVAFARMRF
jgi:hypothetical protein